MKINADFSQKVVVHSDELEWADSPMLGVSRRSLDRVGNELARATTIVRYAPGSKFSPHVHTGGEEFIVIEGVFQDEHGDFPVGSYIRNPPQSSHTPGSECGCVIFVKLWQFDLNDRTHVRLNSNFMRPVPHRDMPGVSVIPLYMDDVEEVSIQHWSPGAEVVVDASGGAEFLVLDGEFRNADNVLRKHSWLRLPLNSGLEAVAGHEGARVWIKQNHLLRVNSEIERLSNY